MERIESAEDEMRGVIRYRLSDGRMACFDARAVREYGIAALLQAEGYEMPAQRLDVYQDGRKVGTLPPDFEPAAIRSRSIFYDPRPGDFRREGETWVANRMLGPGDLEAVPGFQRTE